MSNLEIKKIRKKMGLTQNQFGKMLGVGARSVQTWENGTGKMSKTAQILLNKIIEDAQTSQKITKNSDNKNAQTSQKTMKEQREEEVDISIFRLIKENKALLEKENARLENEVRRLREELENLKKENSLLLSKKD